MRSVPQCNRAGHTGQAIGDSPLVGWNLGKDIAEKYPGEVYGSKFFDKLGVDLRRELPGASGFSKVNLIYCLKFYELYSAYMIVPQPVEQSAKSKRSASKMPQVAAKCVRPQAIDDKIL